MTCDPNLTIEYNLRNWINVLNKTHKDAKDPFEKECLKAYICFFSNWILHDKDLSKAYEALDNYLNNNFTSKKIPPSSSKRPNRSIQNSKKREDLLGAALAVSWNFRDQCKNVSDFRKEKLILNYSKTLLLVSIKIIAILISIFAFMIILNFLSKSNFSLALIRTSNPLISGIRTSRSTRS